MTISLSDAAQKFIEDKVRSGQYTSPDAVIDAALEALSELEAHSLDNETLDAIDRGEDQIERGEVHDWKDVREQVRASFLNK